MKSLTYLVICFLLLSGCQTDSDSQEPPTNSPETQPVPGEATLGGPFTLAAGQSAAIEGTGLTITFEMVERDGRCPSAVNCSEHGPVVVIISAVQSGEQPATFTMNPNPEMAALSGMPPNSVDYQGYEIELTAVDPYPEQPEDLMNIPYTAALVVRENG